MCSEGNPGIAQHHMRSKMKSLPHLLNWIEIIGGTHHILQLHKIGMELIATIL